MHANAANINLDVLFIIRIIRVYSRIRIALLFYHTFSHKKRRLIIDKLIDAIHQFLPAPFSKEAETPADFGHANGLPTESPLFLLAGRKKLFVPSRDIYHDGKAPGNTGYKIIYNRMAL